ncbi:MAG: phosphate ABC transporter permease PstA [Alphaproteobacteria bacterium]|nr:phosphate ABC transporter permease PstA [Alphaproteobacteria bacterium]
MPDIVLTAQQQRTRKRNLTEKRFRRLCFAAIAVTAVFLAFLVMNLGIKAVPAFTSSAMPLTINVEPDKVDSTAIASGDFPGMVKDAIAKLMPKVESRADRKKLYQLLSGSVADEVQHRVMADPSLVGKDVTLQATLSADADMFLKGQQTSTTKFAGTAPLSLAADGEAFKISAQGHGFKAGEIVLTPTGALRVTETSAEGAKAEALVAPDETGAVAAGQWQSLQFSDGEDSRRTSDLEAVWLQRFTDQGKIQSMFDKALFTNGDSRAPEQAGLRGAFIGSLFTILVTLLTALPLGVAAALYLEEFAPKNRFTDLIEVNINNLAAVPSIIFGLLGLAMFLNFFGLPRSSSLVGGLVLALLVLPTIIIASRAALRSVPPSIKEAALGVGASHQQAVFHHVMPLAVPGILTGTILGIARALGETAPLLMIGMIAFIADVPGRITDAATVLPVQVYLWSTLPEAAFRSRTSAAIIILMIVLLCFNALAIFLRNKFERRW